MESVQAQPGLPSSQALQGYRIWDSYFTPSHSHPGKDGSERLIQDIERSLPAMRMAHFERACLFSHVGIGTTTDRPLEQLLQNEPQRILKPFARWPELLIGMIQLNSNDVDASLAAIDRWIGQGPMAGVYLPGSGPGARPCNDPAIGPLIERVAELRGVVMVHTWFKTGGKTGPGESTPAELAELATRFPHQAFICAHAGGEWERGIRAIRNFSNVFIETSGFDPTAGFIEMAIREIGAKRIVFGSHLPSRSLGTELGKIIGSEISEEDKQLILGGNYRELVRCVQ